MAKAKTTKKKSGGRKKAGAANAPDTSGKHLVIVESPTKAKTINKYLGKDYVVMASVGHVRDLPSRAPKGEKQPVPGVDLEHNFAPTYEVMADKKKTVTQLKKAAKNAADVWFATDLDREGEAIAWHLAESLGVPLENAKRVVFNAITKSEIESAFSQPRDIDEARVNAQQARRILDRIVGYQVSPLLWRKVAGGLSAGRVQSVAVRLVVEREAEIDAFIPDEYWKIAGMFATDLSKVSPLSDAWRKWLSEADDKGRSQKDKLAWLSERDCLYAELVEFAGETFAATDHDAALAAAQACGFNLEDRVETADPKAKGPAQRLVVLAGGIAGDAPKYAIESIQTKRTTSRPGAPYITSTMQQAASNRLGFALGRTMRVAQQLYEGIDLGGALGQTGLITYMRTDSTHLSGEALDMARGYIDSTFGSDYLPEKPNFYTSSNKAAQEAHEAIRPTDAKLHPDKIKNRLSEEQYKLYRLIWQRFISCQMTPAQWDSTTVMIAAETAQGRAAFKATGRILVFDGFYKVTGVPGGGDTQNLPRLEEKQPLGPIDIDPTQHFTSPPPRYTEASLQKKLEEEGIGRPSTYAAIIDTIQRRKYVEQLGPRDRRLRATDLGIVVTEKLIQGFPRIMDVAYTREMENELDQIESEHHDWIEMLKKFYGPFKDNLDHAHETMTHAKAEMQPAPYKCEECGSPTVYRFGRNGRFLSCTAFDVPPEKVKLDLPGYKGEFWLHKARGKARPQILSEDASVKVPWTKLPKELKEKFQQMSDAMPEPCTYAAPIDKEGKPIKAEQSDILCPNCGGTMSRRKGRFGPFLGCDNYPECKGIVKLDPKKGTIVLPKAPPLEIDLPCPKCDAPLNMRRSKRGPWLSCSRFPKCRGRMGWNAVDEAKQEELEKALAKHEAENPVPDIVNAAGEIVDETYVPQVEAVEDDSATRIDDTSIDSDAA